MTVRPLVVLWGFRDGKLNIPSESELEEAMKVVSYRNITIDENAGTVKYLREGVHVDLGAIAKGYAVDRAVRILQDGGVKSAMVDIGRNIRLIGTKPGGKKWRIGVQDPRDTEQLLGVLELQDESTATSGDYEKFFILDGKRVGHIIDARTGKPAEGICGVTIVAADAAAADALSTAVFVLGSQDGLELLRNTHGVEGIIAVEKDGRVEINVTEGLAGKWKPL